MNSQLSPKARFQVLTLQKLLVSLGLLAMGVALLHANDNAGKKSQSTETSHGDRVGAAAGKSELYKPTKAR